jgi:hypothetical protein
VAYIGRCSKNRNMKNWHEQKSPLDKIKSNQIMLTNILCMWKKDEYRTVRRWDKTQEEENPHVVNGLIFMDWT